MSETIDTADIIRRAAESAGVDPDLLVALLDLESEFPDFNIHGAKTRFTKLVAELLDKDADVGSPA